MSRTALPAVAVLLVGANFVNAQNVPREAYLRHLPAMPPLVTQTAASARLALYGAAGATFRDEDPVDGIDDDRGRRLLRIAHRFSPVLRRNTFSAPRFFETVLSGRPVLHLDTWRRGRLIRSDSVLLYDPLPSHRNGDAPGEAAAAELARSDTLLERFLDDYGPSAGMPRTEIAEGADEVVAFFDFPGEGEASWRAAYQDAHDKGTYAHFFIHEDPAAPGEARYSLVVQYWFFYPFNDGGNNHEGDWEHLSVLITTPERAQVQGTARGLLTEADIARILDPASKAADSLVIRAVEYYFHESSTVIDYLSDYRPRSRWQQLKAFHVWQMPDYVANTTYRRLRRLDRRLETHPLAYVGGNNKGPDELLKLWPRFGGSYNRDSHGSYPFPGTWQGIGALGATERIGGAAMPRLRQGFATLPDTAPLERLFADDHIISFKGAEIRLLPDWERLTELGLERPEVGRAWGWLLLPIRWGYPATQSPGAGAIEHVNLGQVAPAGPAFQPTWNRLAAESGWRVYTPRVMRGLFVPLTPWDRLINGWGMLNIPIALLGFMPGWSVALTQLGPWLMEPVEALGGSSPKTFAPAVRTTRFTSMAVGWHWQYGGPSFGALLHGANDAALALGGAGASATTTAVEAVSRGGGGGPRASLSLHYGPRFTVQNAFAQSTSRLGCVTRDTAGRIVGDVRGTLALRELTGGFHYAVLRTAGGVVALAVGGGWGWTWYRVTNVSVDGAPVPYRRKGGYPVSIFPSARWWPNTWYDRVGVEVIAPRPSWLLHGLGYGLELQYTGLLHRLGPTGPGKGGSLGSVTRQEFALMAVIGW